MRIMKNVIQFFLVAISLSVHAQEGMKTDTIAEKYTDIETVVINDKDYEKVDYSYGLKQEINNRLKIGNSPSTYEMGLEFKNNLKQKGRISNVVLFLHKTDPDYKLVDLEINFYKIDALTGKPQERLNTKQIIYTPKNKKRTNVKINVENYHIPFPEEGVLVAVRWLHDGIKDKDIGPSVRLTTYKEILTYTRYDEKIGWGAFSHSRKPGIYTNLMMGLEIYIKKKKDSHE